MKELLQGLLLAFIFIHTAFLAIAINYKNIPLLIYNGIAIICCCIAYKIPYSED